MKKRLAEGMTLMVLLLVLWNMAAHTDRMAEAQIKHFTAFFPTEGNSLDHDAADYLHLSVFTEIFCHRSYTRWRKRIIPYKSEGAYAIPSCRCPLKTV